jgi:hypothetical protein
MTGFNTPPGNLAAFKARLVYAAQATYGVNGPPTDTAELAREALYRIEKLERALERYGQHHPSCFKIIQEANCNCGFEEALK